MTGASGQLATDVIRTCETAGDDVVALDRASLDISDPDAVRRVVVEAGPDLVINCAAWTAVDACESDETRALAINGTAVEYLGEAARATGAHLVQVSTDYVFDGTKSTPYVEKDEPNPQSVYGASKLVGEQHALRVGATVVRTSWVCSAHGGNMVETVLRLANEHPTLSFVDDQVGHPTFTADLAPALRALGESRHDGLVHVTNAGAVSWFEFAQEVLRAAGQDPLRVRPVATADLQPARPAPRPANSVLSTDHFVSLGFSPPRDFRDALAEAVTAYL